MKSILNIFSIFLLLVITSSPLIAQEGQDNIVTDRPSQSESAYLVPTGKFQLETGFLVEKDGENKNYTYNVSSFRYGVNEHFELRLITEYLGTKSVVSNEEVVTKGMAPLVIGTKLKVAENNGLIPEVAFVGHLVLKTGAAQYQPDYVTSNFRFSMEYGLSDKFSLGCNLGAKWNGSTPNATGVYTFIIGYGLSDRIALFSEVYGFLTEQAGSPDHRFNGGATYRIASNMQLDISGGLGLSDVSPDNFISTGFSIRLPN